MATWCKRLLVPHAQLWIIVLIAGVISATKTRSEQNADTSCSRLQQYPRYVAARKNTKVHFICHHQNGSRIWWYKMGEQDDIPQVVKSALPKIEVVSKDTTSEMTINKIQYEDNGIYLCENASLAGSLELKHRCGSELRVIGFSTIEQVQNRNTMKDAIIMIQSILLVIFVSVPMLLCLDKGDGKDSSDEDHTYEGLEIEQTATYEDIAPFRDVKAKWTVGEHPCQE
ncbi:PREDICTED: B-cell antigen receptor complex-associated protein beta chain [Gavialis gangeticus]|uniref:B-cell antigen receptor complex-associated protein beta chain n=1 Tax=Gavialis gangeticus TaxID=94835 RepID=UPI00092F7A7C|nr:PREDICTED: B-cell antigen receptor complex-associated protein beta chain [Gavialis gangeticus]